MVIGIEEIKIREIRPEDVNAVAELVVRLKRLNEEFDPLLKVRDDVFNQAKKYIESAMASENSLILVADRNGKIVGVVKVDIQDRIFYEPKVEGTIRELYVLPEFRRRGLAKRLIETAIEKLKGKIGLITAEFPTMNEIAVNFYNKLGFRGIISTYAIEARE